MLKHIPYGRQYIDKNDRDIVLKSLKKNLITTGDYVKKFEKKISKFLKVKYVTSCNSGTSALHLSFCAANLKKNDVIIMPAINFVSAYNMAVSLGAKVYLADVDPQTGQMTPATLINCIKKNKIKKIKIILTMYMGGYPENAVEFYKIKKKFNCLIIEDACHAFGSRYFFKNKYYYIGSCKHADISTFSLHPLKPITTGEGGIVTTNNPKFFGKTVLYRSHGIIRNKSYHWKYNVITHGYNYRLSDINCALGISQLNKIHIFLKKRKKIYNFYIKHLDGYKNKVNFPKYNLKNMPSYHLMIMNINLKNKKDEFFKFLLKNKIIVQFHYIPLYKFSIFKDKLKYKNSEKYYSSTVSVPIFHELDKNKQLKIIKKIKNFINK